MILNDEQKRLVIDYCRQEAESSCALADQMEKIPSAATTLLAKRERTLAAAHLLVAERLESAETMTISGGHRP